MAKVLHIEDDPNNRLLVRKLLTRAHHDVVEAETGLAGVRMATSAPPDLVLVDTDIPDLDGYEVILRLRGMADLAGVPIVAVTAEGDRETVLAVGADGFIAKPIDARRFVSTLERFLSGHRETSDRGPDTELKLRVQSQKIVQRLERKVVELSEVNTRLEEMARLRREFLQNVSHELATPLTPVVGYVRLLMEGELGPLTPLQQKCLKSVIESTQRLRTVVDTLLDVSSLESGRMHFYAREYDFTEVARRAVNEADGRFSARNVVVELALPVGPYKAFGDPDKLLRSMAHVLENASKFTPRGGKVAVAVERTPEGYEFAVADSGPGVPASQLAAVLEPFYQVDGSTTRSHGGVGLGLAFARSVCDAMGGGIRVVSPPDRDVAGCRPSGTLVVLAVATETPVRNGRQAIDKHA